MIEETAIVIAVEGHRVWIEKSPQSSCQGCAQKTACSTHVLDYFIKKHPIEVETKFSLKLGDQVIIGIDEQALMRNSLLIYLFPLLALFVFGVLGQWIAIYFHYQSSELLSIISGLFGFFICLSVIRRSFNSSGKYFQLKPVVLRKA